MEIKKIFRSRRWSIFFLVLISLAVFLNSLLNGFSVDDAFQVTGNRWIRDPGSLVEIFRSPLWAFQAGGAYYEGVYYYYRPLMHVMFMIDYYLFGLSPWGYHLGSVIINTLNVVLVYLIAFTLFKSFNDGHGHGKIKESREPYPINGAYLALASALIFAVHPAHTEAVAWVSAVVELLFSLFFLISLYFYMISSESARSGKRGYFAISIAAFGISLFCKETAVTLVPVIIAYDLFGGSFGLRVKRYIPYAVVLIFYFVVRTAVMGSLVPENAADNLSSYQIIINLFPLTFGYIKLFFYPFDLNFFHLLPSALSIREPGFLISIAVVVSFLALFIIKRKDRIITFTLLWALLTLAPALYVDALRERYIYLPSVGFIIFVLYIFAWAIKGFKRRGAVFVVVILLIAGAFTIKTVKRNRVWNDDYTLWKETAMKVPQSAVVYINLGMAADALGMREEALRAYNRVLEIAPKTSETYYNIGLLYFESNEFEKALENFKTALLYTSKVLYIKKINESMGDLYLKGGRLDDAVDWYARAVEIETERALHADANLLNKLGIALAMNGRIEEARESFKRALELNPAHKGARVNFEKTGGPGRL